ncbi:FISUMP domain-containing protein, partial [Candidatus Vampirococcus lugosii]
GSSFIVLGDNSEIVKKQDGTSLSGDSLDEVFSGVNEYVEQQGSTGASDGGGGSTWTCGDVVSTNDGSESYTTKSMPDGNCWTSTNMKHTPSAGNSWCYDDDISNCNTYGRLYDWDAAMTVCEELGAGWSLPSDAQWQALEIGLGCTDSENINWRCDGLGWNASGPNSKMGGLISSLPGYRITFGSFYSLGIYSYWWSSTESGSTVWSRHLLSSFVTVNRSTYSKVLGFSVVCALEL